MGENLWVHFVASMSVVLNGYALAIIVGVPLGMAMAFLPIIDCLFGPLIMILRPVPPPAWIPLAILWFGIGLSGKVFVVFIAAVVPCLLNAYLGVKETPQKMLDTARMLGAGRWTVFREVVIPSALPILLTGMRIALGNAWATPVAAELVVSTAGFGFLIISGYRNFEVSVMAAAMFPIALIGATMNIGFLMLEKYLGGCPRIENLLRISRIWSDFPLILVKYNKYSSQIMKKLTSNLLSLATAPILGQPPSTLAA